MAKVNFIRKHTKAEVNGEPIVDGNFIVTGEGNVFIDYGTERIEIISSGGSITGDTLPIGSITAYGKESDTDVYSCNYINNLNIYSTEETRIGKWIDGKPIYRKVVDLGNLLNANSKLVAHNIANIDFITSISGLVVSATNHYNIPWTGTPLMLNGAIISIRADRTNIGIANTTNLSSYTAYAFIEYTKTTD